MAQDDRGTVRIGIVGCGRAGGELHVPALRNVNGAAAVALSDTDAERLRRVASRCGGAVCHPGYQALVEDPSVDLVAVCVPVTMHAAVASAAYRAGKHVFIEKPLALRAEDCDRLVDEARQGESRGLRTAAGFSLRSHRLVRLARAVIESGRLGEIEILRTVWTADWSDKVRPPWHAARAAGGGALHEIGAHQADLWRYLLASEVESIHAVSRSTAFDDQSAVLQARMTNGALVSTVVSQRTISQNTIEVFGARGSLRLSCYHPGSLEVSSTGRPTGGPWRRLGPVFQQAGRWPAALTAVLRGGDFRHSYAHQWERIVAALHTGGPMPASAHDGRQAARIVQAALRSSEEGTAVTLSASAPPRDARPINS